MKKALSIVLTCAILLTLAVFPAAAEGDRVTLTMLQRLNAAYVVEDNPIIKAWGDLLGVNIEIEAPPISSYSDRRNIIMASGDLPDIIYVGDTGTNYVKWATDGLLLNLTPYFNEETMPNAWTCLTDDELAVVRIASLDNDIYSMPRVQTKPWDGILYRGDWLEKLGLEIPTTPAEFAEVALAFTTQDPDGNGIDDTFGWSLNTVMGPAHRAILSGFGVRPSSVPDADGNYVIQEAQDAYMDYLDWMRDMYANGSMDPEFYLTTMYEDDDIFDAGRMGIRYNNTVVEHLPVQNAKEAFKAANPDGYVVMGPPLMQEGQTVADVYYNPQIWGNYAINADTEHVDICVKFLDAGYTDEVNELRMIGIQGITYETFDPVTRYAAKTPEQAENAGKYLASYATMNYQTHDKGLLVANGNTDEEVAMFNEAYVRIGAQTNRISYLAGGHLAGVNEINVQISDEGIGDTFGELRTKYICGQIEKEELVDFIQNTMAPAYQPILDIYAANNLNK